MLLIGAVLEGLCFALFSGNNNALIYDSAHGSGKSDMFHSYYSKINIALEIAGFIAAISGTYLAARSFTLVIWISVIPQILALFIAFRFIEPPRQLYTHLKLSEHLREVVRCYKQNYRLRMLSAAAILGGGVSGAMFNMLPTFYRSYMSLSLVGSFISFNYFASVIGFRASGWFMKKFRPLSIVVGEVIYARVISFAALVLSTPVSPYLMALSAAMYAPSDVAKQHLLHIEFTDAQRATMDSVNSLLRSVVYTIFIVLAGYLADTYSPRIALLVCNLLLLPMLCIYLLMRKLKRSTGIIFNSKSCL
jgi:MFS family permease